MKSVLFAFRRQRLPKFTNTNRNCLEPRRPAVTEFCPIENQQCFGHGAFSHGREQQHLCKLKQELQQYQMLPNRKKDKKTKRENRLARNSARASFHLAEDLRLQQQQLNGQSVVTHVIPRLDDVVPELPEGWPRTQMQVPQERPGRGSKTSTPVASQQKPPFVFWSTTTFSFASGARTFTRLEPKELSELREFSGVQSKESKDPSSFLVRNIHNKI